MPNCQTCGVSMTSSERTKNHQGVSGNWHTDCEYIEHVELLSVPAHKVNATAVKTKLTNRKISQAATPTAAPAGTASVAGGSLSLGNYKYVYTNVSIDGESLPAAASANIATNGANLKIAVTGVLAGTTGTLKRNLYRTLVGGTGPFYFVTQIADNTTTIFTDATATDAAIVLLAQAPQFTTFTAGEFP